MSARHPAGTHPGALCLHPDHDAIGQIRDLLGSHRRGWMFAAKVADVIRWADAEAQAMSLEPPIWVVGRDAVAARRGAPVREAWIDEAWIDETSGGAR